MAVNLYPVEVNRAAVYQIAATSDGDAVAFCSARFGGDTQLIVLNLDDTGSSEVDFITPAALQILGVRNAI